MSAEASASPDDTLPDFTYTGEDGVRTPLSVRHLRVHPSVRVVPEGAFRGLRHLAAADLSEGLLEIGAEAFSSCRSLARVSFPSTLLRIGDSAFSSPLNHIHVKLVEVRLPEGLEEIGEGAFADCPSLERINVPSTVRAIPQFAFVRCASLKSVELSEGLQEIRSYAFHYCISMERINMIPSTVSIIGDSAFMHCWKISELILPGGLRKIGRTAFKSCHSLRRVTTSPAPKGAGNGSSLSVGERAFDSCHNLSVMDLPDAVEAIGECAFIGTGVQSFRVPPSINKFAWDMLCVNGKLFSMELPGTLNKMEGSLCTLNLRNVAIPPNVRCPTFVFLDPPYNNGVGGITPDLCKVFPSSNSGQIALALKQRFDGLPIHGLCYYHSYATGASEKLNRLCNLRARPRGGRMAAGDAQDVLGVHSYVAGASEKLNGLCNPKGIFWRGRSAAGDEQDVLGMTPLHILACSARHDVRLYQTIIDTYPGTLVAKDKWGDIPLLYAFWSHAPAEVVRLLVESHKSSFPGHTLDWRNMLVTLGGANASLTCIKALIKTHRASFRDNEYDLQGTVTELAESGHTLKKTVRFLLEHDVSRRLSLLAVKGWGKEIRCMIEGCFSMRAIHPQHRDCTAKGQGTEKIVELYGRLTLYERLKAAASLLELALWKAKFDQCALTWIEALEEEGRAKEGKFRQSVHRDQCRISCGANIVVPNVLPYLVPPLDVSVGT